MEFGGFLGFGASFKAKGLKEINRICLLNVATWLFKNFHCPEGREYCTHRFIN